jgi:putative transposase
MRKARKIRLNLSEQDAATLEFMQGKCRGLYNWWVMRLRAGERWNWQDAKKTLAESRKFDPALDQVYGKLLAEVYFRLGKAMKAFFRRVAAGEKPGFPRVRSRHQFFTLCYPAMYVRVEGNTVLLPTGGGRGKKDKPYPTIAAGLTESPPTGYREVAVSRDARGHYHASFVYEVQGEAQAAGSNIAFDLGIKTRASGVNEHGRFYHVGGFKGYQWYVPSSSIRFVPGETAAKRSLAGTSTSPRCTSASPNRSATSAVTVCTKPPISSLTHWLRELW